MAYQLETCSQCGAGLPVNGRQVTVTCEFCGSVYDVIVHDSMRDRRKIDGQIQIDWASLFAGGLVGFIVGGLIFTPFGRSLGKGAITRGAKAAGIRVR